VRWRTAGLTAVDGVTAIIYLLAIKESVKSLKKSSETFIKIESQKRTWN